ncbi:MAG: tetratricopeptide repeat protein, partial [Patescibacteria group bacterium]|nr:tetratricopeptide repeat protein [Patescibacteria group bacterium]
MTMRMRYDLIFLLYMFLFVVQPSYVTGQTDGSTETTNIKNPASSYNPRALDHFLRGMLYDDQGNYAQAILEYQDAIQYDSTASIFYFSMGEDYAFLRKEENAIKMFEKYLQMEPRDLQAHQYLAELYKRSRQIGKLEWVMERMRWMDQYQPEFYYDLLQIYLINGKTKKASDLSKELLTGENVGETIFENVKGVYLSTKKIPDGISLFEQIVLDKPLNAFAKYELGDLYIVLGDSVRGQKNIEEAIALDPEHNLAMQRLSEIYLVRGEPERALPYFDKIDVNHRLSLANHYFRVDADSVAEPLFNRIHDQFPDDPRSNLYLGVFAMRKDNFDQARTMFEKAIELDSTQDIYYFWAGNAVFRLQIYDQAIKYFKKAAEINSSNSDSYFWLAWSYFRLQKYRDAEESITRVLDLKPGDKDAQDMLADIYYNQGKFSLAEELYIRLIQEDTANVKAM